MKQNRPISPPHLQWYKPQLTSVLSITHRASGVVLVLGLALVVIWIIATGFSPTAYAAIAELLSSWPGKIMLALMIISGGLKIPSRSRSTLMSGVENNKKYSTHHKSILHNELCIIFNASRS